MNHQDKHLTVDFLRHGEPEGGDILRGRIDPVLTPRGWEQMSRVTGLAQNSPHGIPQWTHIVTSPLQRCRAFAESAAQRLGLEDHLRIDDNWQEIDYGDWDGMQLSEWRRVAREQFEAFRRDLSALRPPNGEDYPCFRSRVLEAFAALKALPPGSHVLVVTHGGVMRVVLPTVLGMPLNRSYPLHIPFACYSRVRIRLHDSDDGASLVFHNPAEREISAAP